LSPFFLGDNPVAVPALTDARSYSSAINSALMLLF